MIYCDNQGAIALARNPKSHFQSKNIDKQWHYQCKQIKDRFIEFRYILTKKQIAVSFTKAFIRERFIIF